MNSKHSDIHNFLTGGRSKERIVRVELGYKDNKATVYYRSAGDVKRNFTDDFYPFCWATQEGCRKLFNGNRGDLIYWLNHYSICCKGLKIENEDGSVYPRTQSGYRVMFQARRPMSWATFQDFFIKGGRPLKPEETDVNYGLDEYITMSPAEQYMVHSGNRMFKGFDDYNDLKRLTFDIETEGLDARRHRVDQYGIRTNRGYSEILNIQGDGAAKAVQENEQTIKFLSILDREDPDIATGHNVFNFDWRFIDDALNARHHSSLGKLSKTVCASTGAIRRSKHDRSLKLGGEVERYYPVSWRGVNMIDSLHAVRRAMAIDSNMKSARLKYAAVYGKVVKPDRVYVPGDKISEIWNIRESEFAFCDKDGSWIHITPQVSEFCISEDGDNEAQPRYEKTDDGYLDRETGKIYNRMVSGEYIVRRYLEDDLEEGDKVEYRYNLANFLICKMFPVLFDRCCTMGTAGIWNNIIMAWYYEHNLAIPALADKTRFTGGLSRLLSVGFAKNNLKLDYSSLYPSIILTFNIRPRTDSEGVMLAMLEYVLSQREHYKAEKSRYAKLADGVAADSQNDLTPEEAQRQVSDYKAKSKLADMAQLPLKILANSFFGSLGSGKRFVLSDMFAAEETTCTGRQALRLLIHHFSNIHRFPAQQNGEPTSQRINPDTGLIGYRETPYDGYEPYIPLVGDTDGFNFTAPDHFRYTQDHPYISDGGGRHSKAGGEYTGAEADVAEFEDVYLSKAFNGGQQMMGLDIDEWIPAEVNISRKNYADLMPDGSVKLVGNSIKSKKMPKYIEKFLDKALPMLLQGKGYEFLEYYYDYIEQIYNLRIPLKDIAAVGKIKQTLAEYKKACGALTASGGKKARQAWYELAIKDNLDVDMGDTVYYINTGRSAKSSDVSRETVLYIPQKGGREYRFIENGQPLCDRRGFPKTLTKEIRSRRDKWMKEYKEQNPNATAKDIPSLLEFARQLFPNIQEEDRLTFNCVRLDNSVVESEKETFCDETFEYNVAKYIEMFNSRIRPLFVCFDRSIRTEINAKGKEIDKLIITNPSERKYLMPEQCNLVSGQPYKSTDQDTYQQLMTMEDKEIKFWLSVNKKPPYVEEIGMNWDEIMSDYLKRMEDLDSDEVQAEVEAYETIIANLTPSDVDEFASSGKLPSGINAIARQNLENGDLISTKYGVKIGSVYDILRKDFSETIDDDGDLAGQGDD